MDAPRLRVNSLELFPATSTALVVLRALVAIERHLADLRRWSSRLETADDAGRPSLALEAMLGLHRAFEPIAACYLRVRRRVVAFDGATLGKAVGSLGELGLRAQMLVIVVQLNQLRQVMLGEPLAGDVTDPRPGATDRASTPDEIGALLRIGAVFHQAFDRLAAMWWPHRPSVAGDELSDDVPHSSDGHRPSVPSTCMFPPDELRAKRYRAAVRQAQHDMAAVAEVPSVAAFLAHGVAGRDRPSVQSACILISVALGCCPRTELQPSLWFGLPPRMELTAAGTRRSAGGSQ